MGVCGTKEADERSSTKILREKGPSTLSSTSSLSSLSEMDMESIDETMTQEGNIRGLLDLEIDDSKKISIVINEKEYRVNPDLSVYEASLGILGDQERIPTLCYHPYLPCARLYKGKCGICEVEDVDNGNMIRSCRTTVYDGLKIRTNSEKVEKNVTTILRKKLSGHILSCPSCPVQGNCYFEKLLQRYGVSLQSLNENERQAYFRKQTEVLTKNPDEDTIKNESLEYDPSKCLTCYRCVRVCQYIQGNSKSSLVETDTQSSQNVRIFKDLEDYHENMFATDCIECGMCSFVCPVGAITENSRILELQKIIREKTRTGKMIICQVAPSVRITISEIFNLPPGTIHEGSLVQGLKDIGFDFVFDTSFGADLCIMEEAQELLERVSMGGPFPMFTSCCPAWVNLVEKHYPELIPNLSSAKSPQAMLSAIITTYWAEKVGLARKDMVIVSIMPCVAKKSENQRTGISKDVDFTLTTREIGRMFRKSNIDLNSRKKIPFDDPLGSSSSAAVLFGASGGVMEAALRTAYEMATGDPFPSLSYGPVRGLRGLKCSVTNINNHRLKIAVCSGGANIRKFIQKLKYEAAQSMGGASSDPYFIEAMACPGGCIGGGGTPKFDRTERLRERINAIYPYDQIEGEGENEEEEEEEGDDDDDDDDKKRKKKKKINNKRTYRKSHENPKIKELYNNFLQEQGSRIAKKLLHTKYKNRKTSEEENLSGSEDSF